MEAHDSIHAFLFSRTRDPGPHRSWAFFVLMRESLNRSVSKISDQIASLKMPIKSLVLDPANARKHGKRNLETIKASLARFGQRLPVVVQKKGMIVRAGNARVMAALELGWTHIAALVVDESDIEASAFAVADNRTSELAEWDDVALASVLGEIYKSDPEAAEASGFSLKEITRMLDKAISNASEGDEVPEAPKNPITRMGDIWELGKHRLVCGDSTDSNAVKSAIASRSMSMMFTDPPWNVAIGKDSNPKHRQREGLANDDLGVDFIDFLHGWTAASLPLLEGDLYCVMGCGEWPTIDQALRDAGMHWSATIVWVKDVFVLGRSNYHRRFEPLWYGWPKGQRSSFNGARDLDDVWEFSRPKVSAEHPTMKPIALIENAIMNSSSLRGGVVFDPFMGSGTTLLAAEKTGRVSAGVEISPAFCDVIVDRWQRMTGSKAKRRKEELVAA